MKGWGMLRFGWNIFLIWFLRSLACPCGAVKGKMRETREVWQSIKNLKEGKNANL